MAEGYARVNIKDEMHSMRGYVPPTKEEASRLMRMVAAHPLPRIICMSATPIAEPLEIIDLLPQLSLPSIVDDKIAS